MELNSKFSDIIYSVKDKKPLIHHIANYVTVNDCANIVLALGERPVVLDPVGVGASNFRNNAVNKF